MMGPAIRGVPLDRVLVVAPQPFYEDRGTPICVRQLVKALVRLSYGVDLLTYPIGETPDLPGVRLLRAPNPLGLRRVPIGLSFRKLALDSSLVPRLRTLLRTGRYRLVHAVEEAAYPAVLWGRRYGAAVVYDMHSSMSEQLTCHFPFNLPPLRIWAGELERWLVRGADAVVCSTGLGERVRRLAPNTPVREWRFAAHNGRPAPGDQSHLREQLRLAPGQPVVLYCGTFETYQGIGLLARAMPWVLQRYPGAVLVLVGAEPGTRDSLRRRFPAEMPLSQVRLIERQPRDRVPAYLALADVLVSPRTYGGNLPLKIFDYLAAARPIVATDIPTHRSVLDERLARLVRPEPEALGSAIADLLADPAEQSRLAEAAGSWAAERLGWDDFLQTVEELYGTILPSTERVAHAG